MLKKLASALILAGMGISPAFAADNAGFESGITDWSFDANSTLQALPTASVALTDTYSGTQIYPAVGTLDFGALAGANLGLFTINPEVAPPNTITSNIATASYTFSAATATSDALLLRFFTADGPYYIAGDVNDSVTVSFTGSYGTQSFTVELESEDGGPGYVNATHVSGTPLPPLSPVLASNGVDTGWLSFGVLAGTTDMKITLTNVYDDFGGNAPIVALDYTVGAPIVTVPEPETYAMLMAGLALTGVAARRRRKNG